MSTPSSRELKWKTPRPPAKRIELETWDSYKDEICDLYGQTTVANIMRIMKERHPEFAPSKRQYVSQFEKWGLRKYKSKLDPPARSTPNDLHRTAKVPDRQSSPTTDMPIQSAESHDDGGTPRSESSSKEVPADDKAGDNTAATDIRDHEVSASTRNRYPASEKNHVNMPGEILPVPENFFSVAATYERSCPANSELLPVPNKDSIPTTNAHLQSKELKHGDSVSIENFVITATTSVDHITDDTVAPDTDKSEGPALSQNAALSQNEATPTTLEELAEEIIEEDLSWINPDYEQSSSSPFHAPSPENMASTSSETPTSTGGYVASVSKPSCFSRSHSSSKGFKDSAAAQDVSNGGGDHPFLTLMSVKGVTIRLPQSSILVDEELLCLYAYTGKSILNLKLAAEFLLTTKCYKYAFCLYAILLTRQEELVAHQHGVTSAIFGCALSWGTRPQLDLVRVLLGLPATQDLLRRSQNILILLFANCLRCGDIAQYRSYIGLYRYREYLPGIRPCLLWCLEVLKSYNPFRDFPKGCKTIPTEDIGLICYLWRCMYNHFMEKSRSDCFELWLRTVEQNNSQALSSMLGVACDMIILPRIEGPAKFSHATIKTAFDRCREIINLDDDYFMILYQQIISESNDRVEGLFHLAPGNLSPFENNRFCFHHCPSLLAYLGSILESDESSIDRLAPFTGVTLPPRPPQAFSPNLKLREWRPPFYKTVNEILTSGRFMRAASSPQFPPQPDPDGGNTTRPRGRTSRTSITSSIMSWATPPTVRSSYCSMLSFLTSSSMSSFGKINARAKAIAESSAHGTYDQLPSISLTSSERGSLRMGSVMDLEPIQPDGEDVDMDQVKEDSDVEMFG